MAKALARAQALEILGKAIGREHGSKAASLSVAEQYVQAFSKLAKSTNTLLLPEKTGDISSMVSQVRRNGYYLQWVHVYILDSQGNLNSWNTKVLCLRASGKPMSQSGFLCVLHSNQGV